MSGLSGILAKIPGAGPALAAMVKPIEDVASLTPVGAVVTTALDAVGGTASAIADTKSNEATKIRTNQFASPSINY